MSTPVPTVEDGTLSPYVGTVMALIFNNNYVWVHSRLIRKFPNFAARFEDNQLKMKPVPQGTAHIVVHYLYTGCYEGLKALGTREVDKIKYHFKMGVHVYDLAREYNLYHLEDMATDELQCLAPKLQLGTIITVLDEQEFTHTKISSWLREYITGEVMRVRKSATADAIRVMGDDMKHNRPITGIIFPPSETLVLQPKTRERLTKNRRGGLVVLGRVRDRPDKVFGQVSAS
ncbi:hypothetical protein CEP52_015447 [Fusarium oligoseptatum]|uniref:BTB domain-containing protein n=1 Tax=Fusarium oligoseptatum TaxID=2604345 RepID=A0A428SD24_9HYPO|nr:hypothetical protein CEP52_015447 [Fusarium oligoseptatum]